MNPVKSLNILIFTAFNANIHAQKNLHLKYIKKVPMKSHELNTTESW